jgi:hypothetical protein
MTSPIPQSAIAQHCIVLGPQPAMLTPSVIDIAYAAGFFDGEGNIAIAVNRKGGARGTYMVYNMRLGASQKDPEPLIWLRNRWGGSLTCSAKGHYHWQAFSLGALTFLRHLLPYLIVKRERAILAIEYQAHVARRGRRGRTPEYVDRLAAMKAEMNRLNALSRGAAHV